MPLAYRSNHGIKSDFVAHLRARQKQRTRGFCLDDPPLGGYVSDIDKYTSIAIGIPWQLVEAHDVLWNGVSSERMHRWPVEFAEAIEPGAQLQSVWPQLIVLFLPDLAVKVRHEDVRQTIATIVAVCKQPATLTAAEGQNALANARDLHQTFEGLNAAQYDAFYLDVLASQAARAAISSATRVRRSNTMLLKGPQLAVARDESARNALIATVQASTFATSESQDKRSEARHQVCDKLADHLLAILRSTR
jgi:hypothetical protein